MNSSGPDALAADLEEKPMPERVPSEAAKLMLLRVQLFTAMQTLEGKELDDFWKLLEEVQACRG